MRSDIEDTIKKTVKSFGAELYDIEVTSDAGDTILRIMITKEGGVNLDLCADISRDLSLYLDVNPPMVEAYRLEVSSPGIERKLIKHIHYEHAVGEKAKIKIIGEGQVVGLIKSADSNSVVLEIDGIDRKIEYIEINKARTFFEW